MKYYFHKNCCTWTGIPVVDVEAEAVETLDCVAVELVAGWFACVPAVFVGTLDWVPDVLCTAGPPPGVMFICAYQ